MRPLWGARVHAREEQHAPEVVRLDARVRRGCLGVQVLWLCSVWHVDDGACQYYGAAAIVILPMLRADFLSDCL